MRPRCRWAPLTEEDSQEANESVTRFREDMEKLSEDQLKEEIAAKYPNAEFVDGNMLLGIKYDERENDEDSIT